MNQERVTILGSTGSIGVQTLDIIRRNPERFRIASLVAHSRWQQLAEQAREFQAESVVIGNKEYYPQLKEALSDTYQLGWLMKDINRLEQMQRVATAQIARYEQK